MAQKLRAKAKRLLEQRKLEKTIPHFKLINSLLGGLFICSILLTIWKINIYQKTFIPFKIPLTIWIGTGIIITPFLKRFLTIYFLTPFLILQAFFNVVTWGGIVLFVFMWLNYNFIEKTTFDINERIVSTGHLGSSRGGCRQPYIIVNYKEQEKQLVYYCGTQVEQYKSVDLSLAKGLFGFDVVVQSELKSE